uniref:Uncharacterized protein n=1 Tax=Arundo donax TaxID=35708 RepID=A0A0A9AV24_ARUDO
MKKYGEHQRNRWFCNIS